MTVIIKHKFNDKFGLKNKFKPKYKVIFKVRK